MKQFNITKFKGLHIAENSQTVDAGSLEKADNVIINQDNLIQKRRGNKEWLRLPTGQTIKSLFRFEDSFFTLTQNSMYSFDNQIIDATCTWAQDDKTITITKVDHGFISGQYISDFQVDTDVSYISDFPNKQADIYGTRVVTYINVDEFSIEADTESFDDNVVATGCSYRKTKLMTGETVTCTDTPRIAFTNGNAYFTTDNGVLKLEDDIGSIIEAGIAPGLDISSGILSLNSDSRPVGMLDAASVVDSFNTVSYRVVFGRKDTSSNVVLGSPSDYITVANDDVTAIPSTGWTIASFAANILTIGKATHGFENGDLLYFYAITGATGTPPAVGTPYSITKVDASNFSIDLSGLGYTTVTAFSFMLQKCVKIKFSIPSEITSTEYFYRVYRTTPTAPTSLDDYRLIEEKNLTSSQITAGYVEYLDEVPSELVGGTFLYTNSNQEGSLQANDRPPLALDISLFKNHLFYANCKQYPVFELNLLSADKITNNTYLYTAGSYYRLSTAVTQNCPTVSGVGVLAIGVLTITEVTHGLSSLDQIYIKTPVLAGNYTVTVLGPNTFSVLFPGVFGGGAVTYVKKYIQVEKTSGTVSVAQSIDRTARHILEGINADAGAVVYGSYVSTVNDIPGKMQFIAKDFIDDFYVFAGDVDTAAAFNPNLSFIAFPFAVFVSESKSSTSDLPNGIYISKIGEPEAVPFANFLAVGSRDKEIIRIAPLRDSVIILKRDGVYRLNGDVVSNFSVTLLDGTVICKSQNTVVILNNSVYCLSNQGIVEITDSSIRVISRTIEPLINAIIGDANLQTTSSGVAYESERMYLLSCKSPNTNLTTNDITYVYNYLTDGITTFSGDGYVFACAYLDNVTDVMYSVDASDTNYIYQERKLQKKTDYLSDEFCVKADAKIICHAQIIAGSSTIIVTSIVPHELLTGVRVTISEVDGEIVGFLTAASDVEGLRVVTRIDDYCFTFIMDSAATGSINSTLSFQEGVSEFDCAASVDFGTNPNLIIVNTVYPHGLINGQTVNIDASTFTVFSAIPTIAAVNVTSLTSFTMTTTVSASGDETATLTISDGNRNYNYITITLTEGVQPLIGDGLINGADLYPIDEVSIFDSNTFVVYTTATYSGLSRDLVFLGSGISSIVRFSPISLDKPSELKYYSEFAASFKNNSSCTKLEINFANDYVYSTTPTFWNLNVGTDKELIRFGGWGTLEWGEFPWGGEYSVNKDFYTTPAVVVRTYVPRDCFVGTFIQPMLFHNKAGESLDLQSISVYSEVVTSRTSR